MRNLLASAIEAAGDDAVPLIATMDEGVQSVIIRIEDRGAPGAAKAIQQIFTASTTAKNVELGSELGMFVAQKIIEAHKGEIKAEDYVGRGTVYTIALPATDGVEAARMNAG
jgi:signal transduction histidine kinase